MVDAKLEFNAEEQNFFTPVNSDSYQSIITYLKQHPITVAYKVHKHFIRSAFMFVEEADIAIAKTHESQYQNNNIICSFQLHDDQLFFKSTATSKENYISINFPEKIYKIQRRQDYRLTITSDILTEFKIKEYPKLKCKIDNLSLGGCKIFIPSSAAVELLEECEVFISLKIHDRDEISTYATIVHTHFDELHQHQVVSFKFSELTSEQITQLHQDMIHADRIIRNINLDK